MEYNGALGEKMGHKTPSPNIIAIGKTSNPNVIVEREKKMREMEEIEERRRRVMLKFSTRCSRCPRTSSF